MSSESGSGLRRELGRLESYAVLVGILVGAGIFRVTSDASAATGPSVILAHVALLPIVLATSVAYLVFLSTSLGLEPGGEVLHVSRVFASPRLAFVAAWLKLISYVGAASYLADALAENLVAFVAPDLELTDALRTGVALAGVGVFVGVHAIGVRSFGRLQVTLCALLAVSIGVLVLPGLFAIEPSNLQPFFTGGTEGFLASLFPLFFAYAGFEALAQAAGEVRDSRSELPRVFLRGILGTAVLFVVMSTVAFGTLPAEELGATGVPMSRAAATYLPFGADRIVTLGAILAIATSLNVGLYVPARLAWFFAREGVLPEAFGRLHAARRTPVVGLAANFALCALLLLTGQTALALGICIVALMSLYALHSVALLLLPRLRPDLFAEVSTPVPRGLQVAAAWTSVLALGALVAQQLVGDAREVLAGELAERWAAFELTSLELLVLWLAVGLVLFQLRRRRPG